MLTTANITLMTQVAGIVNAPNAVAGAVGGAPGAPIRATFAMTPAMLRHEDILDYSAKTATMIYKDGCESLTTSFDMKSNGTVIYITEFQAKCNRMGWHSGTQQIAKFPNDSGAISTSYLNMGRSLLPSSKLNVNPSVCPTELASPNEPLKIIK